MTKPTPQQVIEWALEAKLYSMVNRVGKAWVNDIDIEARVSDLVNLAYAAGVASMQAEIDNIKQVEFPKRVDNVAEGWRRKCEKLEAQLDEATDTIDSDAANSTLERIALNNVILDLTSECDQLRAQLARVNPNGLVKDLLIAADLLHERWKAQSN